jgi:low density lipoprotein receptor-related protein 5/6
VPRKTLITTSTSQVYSIAAFQNVIFWLDEKNGLEKAAITGEHMRLEKRYSHITDIVAVWQPEPKVIKNHICSSQKNKCSHICIAQMDHGRSDDICSCPLGLMLMKDRKNCGSLPVCGPDHFTCTSPFSSNGFTGDSNKDCIPVSWRE